MKEDDKSERPGAAGARALARKSNLPAVEDDKSERPGACGARALARKSNLPAVECQAATIIIWETKFETQGPQSPRHRVRNRPGAQLRCNFPISSLFDFSSFPSGHVRRMGDPI